MVNNKPAGRVPASEVTADAEGRVTEEGVTRGAGEGRVTEGDAIRDEPKGRVTAYGGTAHDAERRGVVGPTSRQDPSSQPKEYSASRRDPSDGKIRLSGPLEHDNIVNGYGLRAVLWTQGCPNHCPGCQNPETWDFDGGILVDIEEVEERLRAFPGQSGLTFCGGEPFVQPCACKEIADFCRRELGWNVWSFSGFTYETIMDMGGDAVEFLKSLDALIDGPFVLAERDLTLKFRGSRNQRLLHLEPGTAKILRVE